jgi:ribosomal protein S18 acetylase RimI-like enzyme
MFEKVQELELNAWPDLIGLHRAGWRLRLSGGFTGRANSLTALVRNADMSDADLTGIEAIYSAHRLPTQVRITEFVSPAFDDRLAARGYRLHNPSEFRSARLGESLRQAADVAIADTPSSGWVDAFGRLNGRTDFRAETMTAILGQILLPAGFASIDEASQTIAVGMAVIDRDLMEIQSIAVDATCRGRGLGRKIVESLMAWGRDRGAETAILSVAATNAPAIRLYAGLGFSTFGRYHYRIREM